MQSDSRDIEFVELDEMHSYVGNKKTTVGYGLLVAGGLFTFWSCQKQENPDAELSTAIAASSEMEQYIISGYEMEAALQEFQKALNQIDFSKLEFVRDENGHEVMHLPIQSLNFEAKLRQFNERKSRLHRRFPQIASMTPERCNDVIRSCVQQSEAVATKLLDMGIDIYLPRTKVRNPDILDELQLKDSLSRYTSNPNNVEALFFGYGNGLFDIHIDSANTRFSTNGMKISQSGGKFYWREGSYPNSPINIIGHTHFGNDSIPSSVDSMASRLPGIRYVIFQGGTFHDF